MQQGIRIFFMSAAVAVFAAILGYTLYRGPYVATTSLPVSPRPLDTLAIHTINEEERQFVVDELKYFLHRHQVEDEGYAMIAAYATLTGNRQTVETRMERNDSLLFVAALGGYWRNGSWHKGNRYKGSGICIDGERHIVSCYWAADTLITGIKADSAGIYKGELDTKLQASGHGRYVATDGSYYEGTWKNNQHDGYGFVVGPDVEIKAGQWIAGAFKGERPTYTTHRIYGIDISRYQHGKGRQRFAINWNQMRITYLGRHNNAQVSGTADYPISFLYIKSTEGTTITNPHYAADYAQARRHDIPCGAYHFFSTKSTAKAQAEHFIKHTQFRSGDFPPVLDVEPSQAQINAMGGDKALQEAMRTWLRIVERKTGVKPIIYVSQNFVHQHLAEARDLKRDYYFWIAKYSEYMPDVKMVWWQLSQDGHVKGITGDVDINVFNGYRDQFDEFMHNERM